jgi:hypothetical protein
MNKTNERKKNALKNNQDEQKNESHVLITYLCAGVPNASVHFFENKHTVNHKIDEIYFLWFNLRGYFYFCPILKKVCEITILNFRLKSSV